MEARITQQRIGSKENDWFLRGVSFSLDHSNMVAFNFQRGNAESVRIEMSITACEISGVFNFTKMNEALAKKLPIKP